MKLIYGIQRGILYPATTRFYNDLQARSSNFWGIRRKSRQMSTHVTKRGALLHESERMNQVASTGNLPVRYPIDIVIFQWRNPELTREVVPRYCPHKNNIATNGCHLGLSLEMVAMMSCPRIRSGRQLPTSAH